MFASNASRTLLLLSTVALLTGPAIPQAQAQRPDSTQRWVGTWGAAPSSIPDNGFIAAGAYRGTNQFSNQTIRLITHTSLGGNFVRIRLSNELGTGTLNIGAARIALRAQGGNTVPGTDRVLTFSRRASVSIPNNAVAVSDPVPLDIPANGDLAVSIYLPGNQTVETVHELALQTNYVSPSGGGDATGATTFPLDSTDSSTNQWPILTAVEVLASKSARAVVTLGDSITDGVGSPADSNQRWPNFLAQRLAANNLAVGVVNEGISGNRVLNDQFGPAGLKRFERDVQIVGNANFVTVLLGINDIGLGALLGQPVSAEQIIAGHRQFIARAREMGLKIYGCTLTPAGYAPGSDNENKRAAVNAFIRGPGNYDAVIDFDAATRNPQSPTSLLPLYDSGDGLHPSSAGYQVMADAIDLSLFQ